jgi:uncharacterized membrane protein YqjE
VLAAVSTQNKFLLGGMAVIFIVFSLISSFVLPRRDPNFPGDRRNLFIAVTAVLFVAMLLAVEFFAVEEEEPGGGHEALVASTR